MTWSTETTANSNHFRSPKRQPIKSGTFMGLLNHSQPQDCTSPWSNRLNASCTWQVDLLSRRNSRVKNKRLSLILNTLPPSRWLISSVWLGWLEERFSCGIWSFLRQSCRFYYPRIRLPSRQSDSLRSISLQLIAPLPTTSPTATTYEPGSCSQESQSLPYSQQLEVSALRKIYTLLLVLMEYGS